MNYTIDHSNKAIYFWTAKIGVTSAIETIMHIQSEKIIQNAGKDEITHEIFWRNYNEGERSGVDYSGFKKIFFGRNPYHRIVSSFFDKIVCPHSPGMDKIPKVENYYDFVSLIHTTGMREDQLSKHLDYPQFCDLCEFRGWDFYRKLGKPQFDVVCITPETGLAEAKIIQDYNQIEKIYDILGKKHLFEASKVLHQDHEEGAWNWYKKYPFIFKDEKDLFFKKIPDIQKFFWEDMNPPRVYRYMDFYNKEMIQMFNKVYANEFKFYDSLGKHYMINS